MLKLPTILALLSTRYIYHLLEDSTPYLELTRVFRHCVQVNFLVPPSRPSGTFSLAILGSFLQ